MANEQVFELKHRGSSKIKYEHHMIDGLRTLLETKVEPIEEVNSIIPGRMNHKKGGTGRIILKIQYKTRTGLKCIALSRNKAQEVFIVTDKPDIVSERLNNL